MEYRTFGRTGLRVSAMGIGGGPFRGGEIDVETIREIITEGVAAGINFIETAEDYNEAKLGAGLEGIDRSKVILSTKNTECGEQEMAQRIRESLENLRIDRIDIYGLHSVNDDGDLAHRVGGGALEAMKKARDEGLIRFFGISGHYIPTLVKAIESGEFDVVQLPYNLGHPEAEKLFPVARAHGVAVVVKKVLGGGFLVDPKIFGETPKPGAEAMTAVQAIRFALSNPGGGCALIGAREVDQLRENLRVFEAPLEMSEAEKEEEHRRVRAFLGDDYCRGCKYCLPCDVHGWGFDIDMFLRYEGFYEKYGYEVFKKEYTHLPHSAEDCTQCGVCEPKCPYGIKIGERLHRAHRVLSGEAS